MVKPVHPPPTMSTSTFGSAFTSVPPLAGRPSDSRALVCTPLQNISRLHHGSLLEDQGSRSSAIQPDRHCRRASDRRTFLQSCFVAADQKSVWTQSPLALHLVLPHSDDRSFATASTLRDKSPQEILFLDNRDQERPSEMALVYSDIDPCPRDQQAVDRYK